MKIHLPREMDKADFERRFNLGHADKEKLRVLTPKRLLAYRMVGRRSYQLGSNDKGGGGSG